MKQKLPQYRQFLIDRLGILRTRQKFSARELSLRLGHSVNYINRFEGGYISIPAEVLLEAIEICESNPVEFFYPNIEKYQEHKELLAKYDKLPPEVKKNINDLIDSVNKKN